MAGIFQPVPWRQECSDTANLVDTSLFGLKQSLWTSRINGEPLDGDYSRRAVLGQFESKKQQSGSKSADGTHCRWLCHLFFETLTT